MFDWLERLRKYDQFRDYFNDLEDITEKVIHTLKNASWGKAGKYF